MELTTSHDIPTGRMWRLYTVGWLVYLGILCFAVQLDDLRHGHFNWRNSGDVLWSMPQAFALALIWPLSGWMERRRLSVPLVFLLHILGSAAYGIGSYWLLSAMIGTARPLSWYVWPVMYTMMTYIVIAAIFQTVRMSHARQRQALAIQQAHTLLVASELNALRNKLNPHFLFNTLHSIIALTRRNPEAAETALFQFSDMLRYVLDTEKSGSDRVTLDDELRFVRDYLELESLRLGSRLRIEWELDEDAAGLALPALSLQPLVENSIKHAFNPHSRPGLLRIRTRVDDAAKALTMSVADDGPGADLATVRQSPGLGIRTVERRLQLEYGTRGALRIETAPGAGFLATMSIPLEST
ncbi:sensor histidine kinase [Massilia norwichensis]|uniref:Histidine kinase n=1 Tax=Massilia norwichensis TaxID=1442366 RepID=A0ABT2A8P9_9BURK|nr:histidine kinase [Massilia norwichensis]MCS0590579.1 histidine kinase [Massilia norwichensis]